jgi:hemoglobin-like flavoprotein
MPSLSKRDIRIVQRDWAKVETIADAAATLFYDHLFGLDPSVRPLFKGDLALQKVKLIRMIGAAIHGLGDPDVLMPILRYLGQKHTAFGVRDEHYATVGEALMQTLRQGLGAGFGPDSEAAWTRVYAVLADSMKGRD